MKRGEVKFRPKKIRYLRFSEARVRVRVCACRGAKTESRVLILRSNREGCHANGYKTTDSLFSVFLPLINKNFYCGYRCPKLNGIFFLFCSPQKLSACPSACLFVCTSVRRPVRLLFGFVKFFTKFSDLTVLITFLRSTPVGVFLSCVTRFQAKFKHFSLHIQNADTQNAVTLIRWPRVVGPDNPNKVDIFTKNQNRFANGSDGNVIFERFKSIIIDACHSNNSRFCRPKRATKKLSIIPFSSESIEAFPFLAFVNCSHRFCRTSQVWWTNFDDYLLQISTLSLQFSFYF